MPFYTDQLGRSVELTHTPSKIISLVPSQTELLFDLGLDKEIAGITKFCVHPSSWFQSKIKIGGTKNVNIKMIHGLQPDLIIGNKEENEKTQIEELAKNYPVWISDISTLNDAVQMIVSVGELVDKKIQAQKIVVNISSKFELLRQDVSQTNSSLHLSAAYFIWRKPYMAAGGDTFIHEMMKCCGLKNIFENHSRYPEVSDINELRRMHEHGSISCDVLLLSSEPFPFRQKHIDELQPYLPGTKIILADGEMFSWYGSRLLQAPDYFRRIREEIQQ